MVSAMVYRAGSALALAASMTACLGLSAQSAALLGLAPWSQWTSQSGAAVRAGVMGVTAAEDALTGWEDAGCSSLVLHHGEEDACGGCAASAPVTVFLTMLGHCLCALSMVQDWKITRSGRHADRSPGLLLSGFAAVALLLASGHYTTYCSPADASVGLGARALLVAALIKALLMAAHAAHHPELDEPEYGLSEPLSVHKFASVPVRTGLGARPDTSLFAKHAQHKATKGHTKNRPKKSCPSDIKRAPIAHHVEPRKVVVNPPPEFSIVDGADPDTSGWGYEAPAWKPGDSVATQLPNRGLVNLPAGSK